MLSVVLTDAAVSPATLHGLLRAATARTWNQLSVDGDTSTNDTVFLLAAGASAAAPIVPGTAPAAALGSAIEAVARARPPAGGRRRGRDDPDHLPGLGRPRRRRRPGGRPRRGLAAASSRPPPTVATRTGAGSPARPATPASARLAVLEAAGLAHADAAPAPGPRPSSTPTGCGSRSPATSSSTGRRAGRSPSTGRRPAPRWTAPEILIRLDLGLGDGQRRGLRLRPDRGVRDRELGVHDVSEILVVKLGGTTIADQQQVLDEVAAVARRRPVVLVHGGGKRITEWLERLGVPTRFEGGLRVTDAQALEVAAAVLRGVVNSELVAALRDLRRRRGRPVGRRRRAAHRGAGARNRPRRPRRGPQARPPRRHPRRRPGAGGGAARPRRGGHRLQRERRRRGGRARGRARRPPAGPDDRRRRGPRRRGDEARLADRAGGRGAHRAAAPSRAGWSPRSGPPSPGSRRPGPRRSSATRPRPDALARALDDPTFGTRLTARRRAAAGEPR